MATSVGGVGCDNDILGNRISKSGADPVTYNWDALNRMSSLVRGAVTTNYTYRADGMRTLKSSSLGSTLYRYDGQMGVQDVVLNANGNLNRTVDYALGGRGVDGISTTTGSTTVVSYPLYDTHGNMVSTLTKGSGGSYTYSALRSFDAWGKVRLGTTTGDPTGRYCATLGHKQDDESDLVYMRARYYEPSSGRFVSEDPAKQGTNWLSYALCNPIGNADKSGTVALPLLAAALWMFAMILAGHEINDYSRFGPRYGGVAMLSLARGAGKAANATFFALIIAEGDRALLSAANTAIEQGSNAANKGAAGIAIVMAAAYSMLCVAALLALDEKIDSIMPQP